MRGKPQTKGNEDDLIERRQCVREAPDNQTGITKSEGYRVGPGRSKGLSDPVASHTPPSMRQRSPGGKGEKIQKVLERVYEGRRLRRAWEQIRKNAGAAGIDGICRQGPIFLDDYTNRNLELKFSC